jgi:hypothetical protein
MDVTNQYHAPAALNPSEIVPSMHYHEHFCTCRQQNPAPLDCTLVTTLSELSQTIIGRCRTKIRRGAK